MIMQEDAVPGLTKEVRNRIPKKKY